ncbi:MAG: UDP-N-acetylglucosamine--N-acetylmuramyl-(pentapeptide) pyrophosphoryl-undecaprenol N-acetylglucosamine transferase, partial [Bacillota bacterium]
MKILIGGGGTGGHIYPALALARFIQAEDSTADILFVGTEKGLESTIVPSAGFQLKFIKARGFQRNIIQLVSTVIDLLRGLWQAGRIIDKFKPNVILGTGGYVAAPLVISGLVKRYPVVLHEQNALPGLVNRKLAPFVKKVCLSFDETKHRLPRRSKISYTGNPRASEVSALTREKGCRFFGLDPDKRNILIYGGSRGALKINEVVSEYIKAELYPEGVNFIYVTGEIYYKDVVEKLVKNDEMFKIFPYLEEMPEALAAADLAVTRSGATT